MQAPLPPHDNWFDNFAFTCLAAFAGLLGHIMRSMNERRAITWPRTLVETLASGFIGFLTVLLCRASGVSYEWMGFIAGVFGWLGAAATMVLFERAVRRKLGLEDGPVNSSSIQQGDSKSSAPLGDTGSVAGSDNRGS